MIHFKYHTWDDILGGICAGLLTTIPFYYWLKFFKDKAFEFVLLTIMGSALTLMALLPEMPHKFASDWKSFGVLIGLLSFRLDVNLKTTKEKIINIIISLSMIALLQKGITIKGNSALAFALGLVVISIPLLVVPKAILGFKDVMHYIFGKRHISKLHP
jgi:membrane-associated phospholipid phosphatase